MMKVVINRCCGSFSLSEEAYRYLGLEWDGRGYLNGIKLKPAENCRAMFEQDAERTSPLLVECVEALGTQATRFGCLKIVEIPDDVDWYIDYYEDYEIIRENHRIWY